MISVILAVAVFVVEFQRLGRIVNDRAGEIVSSFNTQVRPMLDSLGEIDQSVLQQELKMLLIAGKSRQWMGQLVYSSIYDLQGKEIGTEIDTQYAHMGDVDNLVQSFTHLLPEDMNSEHTFKRIKGVPYVQLTFPLTNSAGSNVAVVEGVFAVSDIARDEVMGRIARSVFGAMGIVLLTTLILYPVIVTLIRQLTMMTENLLESNIETLRVIGSAIAKRDSDTDSHNYRVTIYSVTLAETVGLKPKLIQGLIKGAFLHDVGKIGISDQILLKPGKLSESEFEIMKLHVNHGIDIVRRSEWLKDATDVVGYHHEKFAGEGYPHGFVGSKIPVNARIFAVADVFDALISSRPYKKAMSFDKAMDILNQGRGSHFDPFHLDTFNTIAKSLYDQFAACSEQKLEKKMESIIRQYFSREYRFKAGGEV
ncbi:MAG: HD-GYP domain-containing protein [Desulfobulbaceae bacterium]|uniref:HD-GYP domain-containing protein n=1 Tax=Candidatus Desulfobia pelagia TaxID=2841692 RepID=A0A8J6TF50_9BACT|nr:HD-GYP domain-containing protein [Candidatus Desulfobia pelagia]